MNDPSAPDSPTPWHALREAEVLSALGVTRDGLSSTEAESRLARFGRNQLRPAKRRGAIVRLLLQFNDVLIYMLLIAAAVTALLGEWVDASVILGVTIINAVIGFLQEGKAESALESIRRMLSLSATCLRDGRRTVIPAELLTPGDVVFLEAGDRVPADLRLLATKGLQVDEAVLTGESGPVEKTAGIQPQQTALADRRSMAYSGTLVTSGRSVGVVVATGERTELGRIGALLSEVQTLTTPLLRQFAQFGHWLGLAIVALAVLMFVFGVWARGLTPHEMFLAAVGLAVAAIPEGLPAVMTITLAIGVQRMAQRRAIIRRLPAVETLGSISVACTDKTGTLTLNEMTLRTVITAEGVFEVSGAGYGPQGEFQCNDVMIDPSSDPVLMQVLRTAVLCNEATIRHVDGSWIVDGDPTEGALLTAAMKADLDPDSERRHNPRRDIIPFESEHRFMATLHHDHQGGASICVKGAPERVLAMSGSERLREGERPLITSVWLERVNAMASQGQRVLALAIKSTDADHQELRFADAESGLTLLGLVGLVDPPRPEAIAAIARCQSAGVRVKMITGDHKMTASAMARQLSLTTSDRVLTGPEMDALPDSELAGLASSIDVFARTSPEHKLRLVQALQSLGHVVAMTGDGVNDAPALKRADVGVAMGIKGTEAAKEASAMVLADDNFASIAEAVEEGRTVYDNLKKAIIFILPTNGAQALVIIAAILSGQVLPITPVQILWINMVSAVTLALALAFEATENDVMLRPPRKPDEPLLTRLVVWRVAFVSVLILVGAFGLFLWAERRGAPIEEARAIAINALVVCEIAYLFNCRFVAAPVIDGSALFGSRPILMSSGLILVLQCAFTYLPPMQALFSVQPIDGMAWLAIAMLAVFVFLAVEIEKAILRRWHLSASDRVSSATGEGTETNSAQR